MLKMATFRSGKSSFLISLIIHAIIGIIVSLYAVNRYIETTHEVKVNVIGPMPRKPQPRLPSMRQATGIASASIQSQEILWRQPNLNPTFKFPNVPNPSIRTSAISPNGVETALPFRPGIPVGEGGGLVGATSIPGRIAKFAQPIKLQRRSDPFGISGEDEGVQTSYRVAYCLDVSSSMESTGPQKLRTAINAVKDSIRFLKDSDQLNIICFALKTREFTNKFVNANYENVSKAMEFLESVETKGSVVTSNTDLAAALEKGARLNPDLLVFITDGRPTAGEFSPEIISQKLKMTGFKGKLLIAGIDLEENSLEMELLKMLASSNNGELRVIKSEI